MTTEQRTKKWARYVIEHGRVLNDLFETGDAESGPDLDGGYFAKLGRAMVWFHWGRPGYVHVGAVSWDDIGDDADLVIRVRRDRSSRNVYAAERNARLRRYAGQLEARRLEMVCGGLRDCLTSPQL
jgi:hypothetical protein